MLKSKAVELHKEINEMRESTNKYMMSEMDFESILDVNPLGLDLLKRCYKLMDTSMEYMLAEAEAIDSINEKLDVLINQILKE